MAPGIIAETAGGTPAHYSPPNSGYKCEQIIINDPSECSLRLNSGKKCGEISDHMLREQKASHGMYWRWRERHHDGIPDSEGKNAIWRKDCLRKSRADLRQNLENYELVIYEREEEIGGTWWLNRYPGYVFNPPSSRHKRTILITV